MAFGARYGSSGTTQRSIASTLASKVSIDGVLLTPLLIRAGWMRWTQCT